MTELIILFNRLNRLDKIAGLTNSGKKRLQRLEAELELAIIKEKLINGCKIETIEVTT